MHLAAPSLQYITKFYNPPLTVLFIVHETVYNIPFRLTNASRASNSKRLFMYTMLAQASLSAKARLLQVKLPTTDF